MDFTGFIYTLPYYSTFGAWLIFFIACNILIIFLRINFYQGILLFEDFIKVLLNYSHYSYTNHNPTSSE